VEATVVVAVAGEDIMVADMEVEEDTTMDTLAEVAL